MYFILLQGSLKYGPRAFLSGLYVRVGGRAGRHERGCAFIRAGGWEDRRADESARMCIPSTLENIKNILCVPTCEKFGDLCSTLTILYTVVTVSVYI